MLGNLTFIAINGFLWPGELVVLFPTATLDVSGARLAHHATMLALRDRSPFLVDGLQRAV